MFPKSCFGNIVSETRRCIVMKFTFVYVVNVINLFKSINLLGLWIVLFAFNNLSTFQVLTIFSRLPWPRPEVDLLSNFAMSFYFIWRLLLNTVLFVIKVVVM